MMTFVLIASIAALIVIVSLIATHSDKEDFGDRGYFDV